MEGVGRIWEGHLFKATYLRKICKLENKINGENGYSSVYNRKGLKESGMEKLGMKVYWETEESLKKGEENRKQMETVMKKV